MYTCVLLCIQHTNEIILFFLFSCYFVLFGCNCEKVSELAISTIILTLIGIRLRKRRPRKSPRTLIWKLLNFRPFSPVHFWVQRCARVWMFKGNNEATTRHGTSVFFGPLSLSVGLRFRLTKRTMDTRFLSPSLFQNREIQMNSRMHLCYVSFLIFSLFFRSFQFRFHTKWRDSLLCMDEMCKMKF